jgi:hypothetical protein
MKRHKDSLVQDAIQKMASDPDAVVDATYRMHGRGGHIPVVALESEKYRD